MRFSLLDQDLVKQSHQPQCEQLLPVLAPPQEAVFITGPRDDKKLIKDVIIRAGPLPSVSEFELFHWILNLIFFVSHHKDARRISRQNVHFRFQETELGDVDGTGEIIAEAARERMLDIKVRLSNPSVE